MVSERERERNCGGRSKIQMAAAASTGSSPTVMSTSSDPPPPSTSSSTTTSQLLLQQQQQQQQQPPIPPPPPPPPYHAPPLPPIPSLLLTSSTSTSSRTTILMDLPHHRLYEFAKSALINIFVSPYATVCDLYCGGGADIDKWDEAQIGHYIGIDASSAGINQAREVWESQRKTYTADFFEIDPSTANLESYMHDKSVPADIVCCMQHLQLCFQNEERVRTLLSNISSLLKPGGYFFGITPDSSTIWTKYQKIVEAAHNKGSNLKPSNIPNSIRSENYIITFEAEEEKFPFFGKRYLLKFANDITSETHNLVHFPSLIRLAREAGLEYVEIQNLTEFYDDNRAQFAGMLHNYGASFVDPRGKLIARSFDILGLYAVFVFQKPDPDAIPPLSTPTLQDGSQMHEEEWPASDWRQQTTMIVEEKNGHGDTTLSLKSSMPENDKGILGPGPAELRFSDHF